MSELTFKDSVNEYVRTADELGWGVGVPDKNTSEKLRAGSWLLRGSDKHVVTIVEPNGSVLAWHE